MTDVDFVTISSGDLTARINPFGAELWSLTDPLGREYMTNADPAFWTGHAPLLFPIIGCLNQGQYHFDGKTYAMPKHGFARQSHFTVVNHEADYVHFRLTDSDSTRAIYPFAFQLDLTFRLVAETLHVEMNVTNPGKDSLPFSFGFHPAFAWPLPGGAAKEDHVVVFDDPEPQPIRRIEPDSGLVLPESFPSPLEGRILHPDPSQFEADALIWDHLESRSVTFGATGGTQISIAFPDSPMLGIWQKPGAAYLCIEPWQGIADPIGFTGDFREKPGVISLPAGATQTFRMDITLLCAD